MRKWETVRRLRVTTGVVLTRGKNLDPDPG